MTDVHTWDIPPQLALSAGPEGAPLYPRSPAQSSQDTPSPYSPATLPPAWPRSAPSGNASDYRVYEGFETLALYYCFCTHLQNFLPGHNYSIIRQRENHLKPAFKAADTTAVNLSKGVADRANLMGFLLCDHLPFCPSHLNPTSLAKYPQSHAHDWSEKVGLTAASRG